MNCEDFNQIIHELADYQPMPAKLRDAGVSHMALCGECAAKLANASTLSRNLVLAAGAESELAPDRVKENLLTAFAELHRTKKIVAPVVVEISRGRSLRWWATATVALAAAILLAVVLPVWITRDRPNPTKVVLNLSGPLAHPDEVKPVIPAANSEMNTPLGISPAKPRIVKRKKLESGGKTQETVVQNTGEYMALTYLAKSTAIESGTVVRVELSRSALASLGWPVTFEGSATSVKADIVIGDDGVAHAIRLVQ